MPVKIVSLKAVSRLPAIAALAVIAFAIGGCSHLTAAADDSKPNPLATWVPSKNHNARQPVIIVIHATEQSSVEASLETLRGSNVQGPVSSHYLIGRNGRIYQLVSEERRAWHAGGGRWGTITDLNSASIGIELDNDGASNYSEPQLAALLVLLEDLCTRLQIRRTHVIAHADLAPNRKTDPGARFPWRRLAQAGFGRWPDPAAQRKPVPANFDGWLAMRLLGYRMEDPAAALRAFRLHFRGVDDAALPMGAGDLRVLYALDPAPWERGEGQ